MCYLQGELHCRWQNARVALQAHISPSLFKAMAGNVSRPYSLLYQRRKPRDPLELSLTSCLKFYFLISGAFFCGRMSTILAQSVGMNCSLTIMPMRVGRSGRRRWKKRGKGLQMQFAGVNTCMFSLLISVSFVLIDIPSWSVVCLGFFIACFLWKLSILY